MAHSLSASLAYRYAWFTQKRFETQLRKNPDQLQERLCFIAVRISEKYFPGGVVRIEFALILKPRKAVDRLVCGPRSVEEERRAGGSGGMEINAYGCAKEAGSSSAKRGIESTERHPPLFNVAPQQHQEKGHIKMPLPIRNVVSPLHSVLSF
jgi:hypothetical protein